MPTRSARMRPRLVFTPDDPAALLDEASYLAVLNDVDAQGGRGARIAPGDRIVPRGAGAPLA